MTITENPDDGLDAVDENKVIELLKTRGFNDPEAFRLLQRWTNEAEAQADLVCTGPQAEIDRVSFEIRRAELYSKAELHDLAEETWTEAFYLAEATGQEIVLERLKAAAKKYNYSF